MLASRETDKPLPQRITDYKLVHKQPGRGGTYLTLNLRVTQDTRIARVAAEVTDLKVEIDSNDAERALDKLAEWMERAASELRARGTPAIAVACYPNGNP